MLGLMNSVAEATKGSSSFVIDRSYFCRYLACLILCSLYGVTIQQLFDTSFVDFGVGKYIKEWQFYRIHQSLRLPGMRLDIAASETIATEDVDIGKRLN